MGKPSVAIARVSSHGTCRSCGAAILWCHTDSDRLIPVDATPGAKDALRSRANFGGRIGARYIHWSTCPSAAKHRKPKK